MATGLKQRMWDRLPARGQERFKAALFHFNHLTAERRRLPDFLIIGTQRGGTTSLYRYLASHPDVSPAFTKEIHYFDINYVRGARWYRAHFPLRSGRSAPGNRASVVGEASPNYLFHPLAGQRAWELVPSARLIVLLRDPVERAFSHYRHQVRDGLESLSFEEALAHEPERLEKEAERIVRNPSYVSFSLIHHSYRARGLYADQLQAWMSLFPPEQFIIESSEDLFRSPGETVARVLARLGLFHRDLGPYRTFNPTEPAEMRPATRVELEEFYRPHNERLYRLLDRDFGW